MRDAVALPLDYYANPWGYVRPVATRNIGSAIFLVDKRAGYLDASSLLDDAALDKYIFVRDAYLQRIASQIEARKNPQKERDDAAEMNSIKAHEIAVIEGTQ
jgi:phospholipid-binding lipoprotein MlaA